MLVVYSNGKLGGRLFVGDKQCILIEFELGTLIDLESHFLIESEFYQRHCLRHNQVIFWEHGALEEIRALVWALDVPYDPSGH